MTHVFGYWLRFHDSPSKIGQWRRHVRDRPDWVRRSSKMVSWRTVKRSGRQMAIAFNPECHRRRGDLLVCGVRRHAFETLAYFCAWKVLLPSSCTLLAAARVHLFFTFSPIIASFVRHIEKWYCVWLQWNGIIPSFVRRIEISDTKWFIWLRCSYLFVLRLFIHVLNNLWITALSPMEFQFY